MLRKLLVLVMALAVGCVAFAQEGGEGGEVKEAPEKKKGKKGRKGKGGRKGRGARKPRFHSLTKLDPLYPRLSLTEEQVKKIEELEKKFVEDFEKLWTDAGEDVAKKKEAAGKFKEMLAALKASVAPLLTEDQKKKLEVGKAILTEVRTKSMEARKAAGKDRNKRKEAMKGIRKLHKEAMKQLDEKVGKHPGKPLEEKKGPKKKKPKKDKGGEGAGNAEVEVNEF